MSLAFYMILLSLWAFSIFVCGFNRERLTALCIELDHKHLTRYGQSMEKPWIEQKLLASDLVPISTDGLRTISIHGLSMDSDLNWGLFSPSLG